MITKEVAITLQIDGKELAKEIFMLESDDSVNMRIFTEKTDEESNYDYTIFKEIKNGMKTGVKVYSDSVVHIRIANKTSDHAFNFTYPLKEDKLEDITFKISSGEIKSIKVIYKDDPNISEALLMY